MSDTPDLRPVLGYEGLYSITSDGQIWSHRSNRWLQLIPSSSNYLIVRFELGGQQHLIHHLVLEAFVGPRIEGTIGPHWDDDRSNNHYTNLYWGTRRDNSLDAIRTGRRVVKVTEETVQIIRRKYAEGVSQNALAKEFGIHQTSVSMIVNRKSWNHLKEGSSEILTPRKAARNSRLTEDLVREIRRRVLAGESQRSLSQELDIYQGTISSVVRRQTWAWVED